MGERLPDVVVMVVEVVVAAVVLGPAMVVFLVMVSGRGGGGGGCWGGYGPAGVLCLRAKSCPGIAVLGGSTSCQLFMCGF